MLSGHSSVLKLIYMQIFRPVQLVVLAAEGKNLDRGSSSSGRAVKILSGHPPTLKLYMCKFSDLCYFQLRLRRVKQVCCLVHYNSDNYYSNTFVLYFVFSRLSATNKCLTKLMKILPKLQKLSQRMETSMFTEGKAMQFSYCMKYRVSTRS